MPKFRVPLKCPNPAPTRLSGERTPEIYPHKSAKSRINNRRRLLLVLGAGALASPCALLAQAPQKIIRIGIPSMVNPRSAAWFAAFDHRLMELGYIEGKNLVTEFQNAEGKPER